MLYKYYKAQLNRVFSPQHRELFSMIVFVPSDLAEPNHDSIKTDLILANWLLSRECEMTPYKVDLQYKSLTRSF